MVAPRRLLLLLNSVTLLAEELTEVVVPVVDRVSFVVNVPLPVAVTGSDVPDPSIFSPPPAPSAVGRSAIIEVNR
jgi:hypothetical protein